jgi:hypothetical protein
MQQRKTERLKQSTPTGPLGGGDLGLLATAVLLRGRRALEKRSPKTLKSVEHLAAMPVLRNAVVGFLQTIERIATTFTLLRARVDDAAMGFAHAFMARVHGLTATLMGLFKRKPGAKPSGKPGTK